MLTGGWVDRGKYACAIEQEDYKKVGSTDGESFVLPFH